MVLPRGEKNDESFNRYDTKPAAECRRELSNSIALWDYCSDDIYNCVLLYRRIPV